LGSKFLRIQRNDEKLRITANINRQEVNNEAQDFPINKISAEPQEP
jgi:hypothetical protein